jgi:hypothetical protein
MTMSFEDAKGLLRRLGDARLVIVGEPPKFGLESRVPEIAEDREDDG